MYGVALLLYRVSVLGAELARTAVIRYGSFGYKGPGDSKVQYVPKLHSKVTRNRNSKMWPRKGVQTPLIGIGRVGGTVSHPPRRMGK